MMTLISRIAQGQQRAGKELTLDRQHVALVVGHPVVMKEVRCSIHRKVIAEIDLGLRVSGRSVQWRRWERESLARVRAVGCSNEGRLQQRRRGAQVVISIGRNAIHDTGGQALECGIEAAETCPDAARSVSSENLSE